MRLIFSYEVTNEELESSVLVLLMLLSLYPVWQIKLAFDHYLYSLAP